MVIVMSTPWTRRRLLAALDRLAGWHEDGLREYNGDEIVDGPLMQKSEQT